MRWKRLDTSIKKLILIRKAEFFNRETEKLKAAGRTASSYSILTKVMDEDAPALWSIADLEPNKQPGVLAEELAVHFTNITNEARKLEDHEIPDSIVPNILIQQLLEENVAKRIREYKKPNSTVPGDIPKSLIADVVDELLSLIHI